MSNLSIFEKKWIELVFEGKNKLYGAYQLRQENAKTSGIAFSIGIGSLTIFSGLGILLSSFSTVPTTKLPEEALPEVIKVVTVNTECQLEQPAIKTFTEKKFLDKQTLINPEISSQEMATNTIKTNLEAQTTTSNPNTSNLGGIPSDVPSVPVATTGGNVTSKPNDDTPIGTNMLDKLPEFPGGMEKFYTYVGTNFNKSDLEIDKTIKVYVSFVIEADGSMTQIKVLRDPGYGLGQEAVRVLKSLKTKWSPGFVGGEKVRTIYNLPITIQME